MATAAAKKLALDNGFVMFPDIGPTQLGGILAWKKDWTLTKERPKNYLTYIPEEKVQVDEERENIDDNGKIVEGVAEVEEKEEEECVCEEYVSKYEMKMAEEKAKVEEK